MRYARTALETSVFRRVAAGFEVYSEVQTPEVRRAFRHAVISNSLFEAGTAAGLSNRMILELANVFGGVIDFALDPRAGDTFSLLYEEQYLDGEKIGEGAIVAAQYLNDGKLHSAYRFIDSSGQAGYFSEDGVSMRKAFLRSPLDITRVSSNFNMRRLHPIARVVRPHRGVDYAASTGTPVYSSGDGRVIASGYSRGNGNYVFIQHGDSITTRYLHLHKRLVNNGARVRQGQTIGTVGATGLATGPHLHYEFLVDGVHRNPRTVLDNLPRARALDRAEMAAFSPSAGTLHSQLESYTAAWQLAVASASD
jgi:murein DD-endopeptidase MepM/ murein hydrolase activator NlpD